MSSRRSSEQPVLLNTKMCVRDRAPEAAGTLRLRVVAPPEWRGWASEKAHILRRETPLDDYDDDDELNDDDDRDDRDRAADRDDVASRRRDSGGGGGARASGGNEAAVVATAVEARERLAEVRGWGSKLRFPFANFPLWFRDLLLVTR